MLSDCRRSLNRRVVFQDTAVWIAFAVPALTAIAAPAPVLSRSKHCRCNYKGVGVGHPQSATVSLTSKVTVRKTEPHRTCQRLPQDGAHSIAAPFGCIRPVAIHIVGHVADTPAETTVNVTTSAACLKLWRLFRLRLPRQCMWRAVLTNLCCRRRCRSSMCNCHRNRRASALSSLHYCSK